MLTLTDLLEAGAHFGHKKERSNPKARKFTYTIRDSVYVIDLEQTVSQLEKTIEFLKTSLELGKTILFVGTKRQAKESVRKTAESLGQPFVVERWLGGMLTNYETINKSLRQLEKMEALTTSEDFQKYTKKERLKIEEKIKRLAETFAGLRNLRKLPEVLFIVDTANESVAVLEANRLEIPIAGICDTNANPDLISYPIPANDDSEKTIVLILNQIAEALKEVKPRALSTKVEENIQGVEIKAEVKEEKKEEAPKTKKAQKNIKEKK